jgi:hypothetical protein
MDALTWFKSVFQPGAATHAPLRADLATAPWADVPLHVAAARLRPPAAAAADEEDWDAVIARAKMQAAWAEMPDTPPPSSARQVPTRSNANATLDAFIRRSLETPAAPRPAFARRPAAEDLATPPRLGKARPSHTFGRGPAGR